MNLNQILDNLKIPYEEIEHPKVFTIEQAINIQNKINGIGCKNLFLTDNTNYYLLILEATKQANLKLLAKTINSKRLTFATEEELHQILNLSAGSVTPFGIINDKENKVILLIEKNLVHKKLLFHPNVNNKTISIEYQDLIKFIEYEKNNYFLV